MACRQHQTGLLARGNALGRTAEGFIPAQAHLNENQNVAVPANQINFTPAHTEIARFQAKALVLQITGRQVFRRTSAKVARRGIVIVWPHSGIRKMKEESPALYVVPTPLGNLDDLSQRAAAILCSVKWVAAEDTRHTAPLLKHIGAQSQLIPAHEHNEHVAAQKIIALLAAGQSVALVSDAGTPGISDPGARIVADVRTAGYRIIPLPGPCAAITALSAAGLTDKHFLFYGFLPAKAGQRLHALETLRPLPSALVFYEAPHRILATVTDLAEVLGTDRTVVIARELTKLFETIHACPLGAALDWLNADLNRQKGEFVLVVSGAQASSHHDGRHVLELLLAEGLPVKQAARLAAQISGESKNELYRQALAWRETADPRP